jgi:integrative and conjugative element protein (TIGR02256 family)
MAHVDMEPRRETGGILLGHTRRDGTVVVTKVSPPGPNAVKLPLFFRRDTRFLQRWLERRFERSDGRDDYVGEWHVHHGLDAPPSCVDRRELWKIARRPNYPTARPLLIIVEDVPGDRRVRAYEFRVRPRKYEELPVAPS